MNFLKRAIISIKRRPGKTIILLLLVFILGNIISGAISVQQAVENTESNLRRNLPAVVTIEQDWDSMMVHERDTGEWPITDSLTPEILRRIGELPYVQDFDYSTNYWGMFSTELERFIVEHSEWGPINESHLDVEGLDEFSIRGVNNPEIFDLNAGIIELVTGRHFTEQEVQNFNGFSTVAVISEEFANLNNLSVGSTFTLDNTIYDYNNLGRSEELYSEDNILGRETYEFEVIGIFKLVGDIDTGEEWSDLHREAQMLNRIYVPNVVAEIASNLHFEVLISEGHIESNEERTVWYDDIIYLLNDPMDLTDFAEAAPELLPEFWMTSDLSNTFGDIASSMETLQWLASLVLWIAIAATTLILSLLITLFLRDRKHEIGIYLALGEKKIKVALQIILEVVTTGMVAITLSLFTGSLIASSISENMIRRDLIAAQESDGIWGGGITIGGESTLDWFYNGEMSVEEMLESYNLSLSVTTIVLLYSVGIVTILISTVVPILYVMRLNPKKIMM